MMQSDDTEEWRSISALDGYYEVSSLGRVRRAKPGPPSRVGKILRPALNRRGNYWQIATCIARVQRTHKVHQLVAEAFCGPRPSAKCEVNHIDGNRLNNRADNLEWTTRTQNLIHAYAHGLQPSRAGTRNVRARLSLEQVMFIRASNAASSALASMFGVHISTVQRVRSRTSWTS